uniref:similar to human chromosome 1 open reading frame 141 isoform c n=1 Tax=Rattus norvegicus TaxID=10116 RepID=UPI0033950840
MTEKILEKFDALEEKARILAAIREKNSNWRLKKKPLITPMLFDHHVKFGDTITPAAFKTVANITEDESNDLKKSKKSVSFKYKPKPRSDFEESDLRPPTLATVINDEESKLMEHKEENLKPSSTSLRFLKDKESVTAGETRQRGHGGGTGG